MIVVVSALAVFAVVSPSLVAWAVIVAVPLAVLVGGASHALPGTFRGRPPSDA